MNTKNEIKATKPERTKTRRHIYDQYFRILRELTPNMRYKDSQARKRTDRILDALHRYDYNLSRVPEVASLLASTEKVGDLWPVEAANMVPVSRSIYMGLRRPLAKSAKTIRKQVQRIIEAAALAAWDGRQYRNQEALNAFMDKVSAIGDRYINNISSHFGHKDGYIENRHYSVPVYLDVYTA